MNRYLVRVKHDKGTTRLIVTANNKDKAAALVMAAERCPKGAIQGCRRLRGGHR